MARVAMDIGGTWIRWRFPDGREGRVSGAGLDLLAFLEAFVREKRVRALGISFAGQVDDGRILSAPNIRIDPINIRKYFFDKHGVDLRIENDLNCAALAEAEDWQSGELVALYSGTGLGSGIITSGRLCRGSRGMAGEIGHVPYRDAPFACGCGKRNCLELYASGSGLQKWRGYLGCSQQELKAMREASDDACRRIAGNYLDALCSAAGTMITLFNPRILVLGGGVIAANPWLLDSLKSRIDTYALPAAMAGTAIELSRLENASLRGAELLLQR